MYRIIKTISYDELDSSSYYYEVQKKYLGVWITLTHDGGDTKFFILGMAEQFIQERIAADPYYNKYPISYCIVVILLSFLVTYATLMLLENKYSILDYIKGLFN